MSDRRQTPANGRVAAAHLQGQVEAERFVTATPGQITTFAANLHAAPAGALDRQLLFGDLVDIYENSGDWAFVQSQKDGYCGYVETAHIAAPIPPTHAVRSRQAHIYPIAGIKTPPLARLPFNAKITVTGSQDKWCMAQWPNGAGFIHQDHLRPLTTPLPDPAQTAQLFLGTPYLWAGNTGDGIDCSGLVQAVCLAADIPCPGDSDQQAQSLGRPLESNEPYKRNDVIFWKGHVALTLDAETMIHATAFGMTTRIENIAQATTRIQTQGDGPVTARRRLLL